MLSGCDEEASCVADAPGGRELSRLIPFDRVGATQPRTWAWVKPEVEGVTTERVAVGLDEQLASKNMRTAQAARPTDSLRRLLANGSLIIEEGIAAKVREAREPHYHSRMEKARRHRRERRVVRFLVAVFGVALVAAGCGTSAPSTAEFSNQANGICHNYSAKLNHVISQLALPRHESREQLESELSDVLGLVQRGSVQLAALGRPDGEVGAIDKVLKAQSAQAKDLLRLVTGIKENDSTMTQSAEAALEESVAPLNQQLDILGMTTCGSGPLPASNGTK